MYFENVKCRVSEARALKRTSKKVKKRCLVTMDYVFSHVSTMGEITKLCIKPCKN